MHAAGELSVNPENAQLLPLFHSVNYLITLKTDKQVRVGLAKKLEQQTSSSILPEGLILFPLFRYNEIAVPSSSSADQSSHPRTSRSISVQVICDSAPSVNLQSQSLFDLRDITRFKTVVYIPILR